MELEVPMVDLADLLDRLCTVSPDRRPGSPGNHEAVDRVAGLLTDLGWAVEDPEFPVVCWEGSPGRLDLGGRSWPVVPSPYGLGWQGAAPMHPASAEGELGADHDGAILLLHGELCAGPLTPKGYPFYGFERDERIVRRLEGSGALAVLAITGRAPEIAGSVEPFALIEDGAFLVPTGNLSEADGVEVLGVLAMGDTPRSAVLDLPARRWPATARNIVARRGPPEGRVVLVAHIDSKPGTPGAIDNATGVVVLARVAELLVGASDDLGVELLIVNGEDHYSAPGEMAYLGTTDLSQVRLAINVDGAGYRGGPTAVSTYGSADRLDLTPLLAHGVVPGPSWPQSDHMVFAMAGCPAIALTSADFATVMEQVAHSPTDTPDLADLDVLESAARGIDALVRSVAKQEER
jgi:aminopeptidase YwaD